MTTISVRKAADVRTARRAAADAAPPPDFPPPNVICDECGGDLELDQPDTDDPDHLIGSCNRCGHKFAVLNLVGAEPLVRRIHFARPKGRRQPRRASA